MKQPIQYLNIKEASKICRISPAMLRKQISAGAGPKVARIGVRIIFRDIDLHEWMEEMATGNKAPDIRQAVGHPMQDIVWSKNNIIRFRENKIVNHLLDNGGIDMNQLAILEFSAEDRMQFAQLIGYSVSGFGELSYAADEVVGAADEIAEQLCADRNGAL